MMTIQYGQKDLSAYRGNLSESNNTTSRPSRASAEAAYEPAGPPPITRAVVFSGIDMMEIF